jgi:hypothetical protein
MYFEILQIYERGVKRSERDRQGAKRITGDLHIRLDEWAPLGRASLSAYIFKPMPHIPDVLPPLFEVRLDGMATLALVIEGVEFVDGQMFQQAWHCKTPDHSILVPWTLCPRSTLDELI